MERAVRLGSRWTIHHCGLQNWACECDPMPYYEEAAAIATELGLVLRRADWTGYAIYDYQIEALQMYKALLASPSSSAVLEETWECALTSAQSRRAWKSLRLEEAVYSGEFLPNTGAKDGDPLRDEGTARTRVRLLRVTDKVEYAKATTETCIFISDMADSRNWDAVETWKIVNELTIGVVYKHMETEVIVAVEETAISTIAYHEGSRMLLRCTGEVGMALELLIAVGRITGEIAYNSGTYSWVSEFKDVADILASSIGVAAMSNFKTANYREKVKPSGSSRWMPEDMFGAILNILPVREGFVDLREYGMQSAVRRVSYTHTRLLCPLCWVTDEPNSLSPAIPTRPLHLVGPTDAHGEYTAVSHLWTEFSGRDTVRSMQNGAAIVGGPPSLWIDKLCINQDDGDEKATELSHMGSYYAGARTTLICPARRVAGVPLTQQSRHLVAMPSHLNYYHQGLSSWRRDRWHRRVWTFQEAYLSRNPQVVNSDTNSGLSACWLDFMAYAAEQMHPTRCEVGLPPFHGEAQFPSPYGVVEDYSTPFMRAWAACSHHNWAPDISSIKMPLATLLELTHSRKCTEERDRIVGVLGLALSSEQFRLESIFSLDDAYREAVRCGALGAEVLLADLGGTSPNSCWIPKDGSKAKHMPCMRESCNALRPAVDSNGRLICKAFEVDMDKADRVKCSGWSDYHEFNMRMNNGTADAHVGFHGCLSTRGRVYMLAAANDTDSLEGRILVCASDAGSGTHHVEATGRIVRGHRYYNASWSGITRNGVVMLRMG